MADQQSPAWLWQGRAQPSPGTGQPAVRLVNTFEGGTSGVAVSTANSGGASGNAFDAVSITSGVTRDFDSARAAHGALSCQIATVASATCYCQWSASLGTQPQVWFRQYLFFTAAPSSSHRVLNMVSGGTPCGGVLVVQVSGRLQFVDSTGAQIFITASAVPLGQWFRIEGYILGSATAGQVELRFFRAADAVVPDEIVTSAAVQNTAGPPGICRFGVTNAVANAGPFWMDDLGLSNTGYLGPAGLAGSVPGWPQSVTLLRLGLPQSPPSPIPGPVPPPVPAPAQALSLLQQGLPQAPQAAQLAPVVVTSAPPGGPAAQSLTLLQRGMAVPGHFTQLAPAVVVPPPPPGTPAAQSLAFIAQRRAVPAQALVGVGQRLGYLTAVTAGSPVLALTAASVLTQLTAGGSGSYALTAAALFSAGVQPGNWPDPGPVKDELSLNITDEALGVMT